jgi:quercetin dioxygenase-like cupin family protein
MITDKNEFRKSEVFSFAQSVEYAANAIVSKTVLKKETGNLSLFAFWKGEELSEHTAKFDALIQVLDGEAEILIDKKPYSVKTGESIIMPANIPHAVKATENFKMLLTMIKDEIKASNFQTNK